MIDSYIYKFNQSDKIYEIIKSYTAVSTGFILLIYDDHENLIVEICDTAMRSIKILTEPAVIENVQTVVQQKNKVNVITS